MHYVIFLFDSQHQASGALRNLTADDNITVGPVHCMFGWMVAGIAAWWAGGGGGSVVVVRFVVRFVVGFAVSFQVAPCAGRARSSFLPPARAARVGRATPPIRCIFGAFDAVH